MATDSPPTHRWFAPTPAKLVVGLLIAEVSLLLIGPASAWNLLVGVGILAATVAAGLIWLVISLSLRRRFQFGVGTLLLLTAVVAIVGGWFSWKLDRARRQKKATGALLEAGFDVAYEFERGEIIAMYPNEKKPGPAWLRELLGLDFLTDVDELRWDARGELTDEELANMLPHMQSLPRLRSLHVSDNPITDESVRLLVQLPALTSLSLERTHVTDAGLEQLKTVTNLESLFVGETAITDAGLAHLRNLTRIKLLYLYETQITDRGLASLTGMTDLEDLELSSTQITDAGLAHLKNLKNLRILELNGTRVTGDGLAHLDESTNLQLLGLSQTPITDDNLRYLKPMVSLEALFLSDTGIGDVGARHLMKLTGLSQLNLLSTQITDAGLVHLREMTHLSTLDISGPQMTNDGVWHLRKALPDTGTSQGGGRFAPPGFYERAVAPGDEEGIGSPDGGGDRSSSSGGVF